MQRDIKKNYQLYGRNDMIMLDEHNKIYGSLGMAEPYIIATKTGETLLLNGAKDNEPFIGLSLYGKSHQNTVAGNQLIPMTVGEEIVSENGFVSATCTEDGVNIEAIVGASTQAHSDIYFIGTGSTVDDYEAYPDFEAGKTYIVRCESLNYSLYVSALRDGKMVTLCYSDDTVGNGTFTPEEGDTFRVFLRPRKVYTEPENEVVHVMISSNMDSPIWEPYTGGQPSPNPDYPQEIVSVGDDGEIGVDVRGGNLLDAVNEADADVTANGVTITNNGDGSFTVTGTPTVTEAGVFTYYVTRAMALEDGNYALSSGIFCKIYKKDSTKDYVVNSFTFDSEVDESVDIYWQRTVDNYVDGETIWPMLNVGSTALPFEPYKQPQSLIVSTPNGLPGIPVSSGGNYTDENGQQWISDEVDHRRGKYVKRVIKRTFGANENISQNEEITDGIIPVQMRFIEIENVANIPGLCDKFSKGVGCVERFNLGYKNLYLWISVKRFDSENPTISDVKNWLGQNPLTVYATLETPIETDLTPEQITAYQSLHTNYPTTTVMNDEGAGMKAIYKQIENGG